MDTDDLSDETYAIIADAHHTSGLLGTELAVSGSKASSESEFLKCMAARLKVTAESADDSWEDYDGMSSASALRRYCRSLSRRVRELRAKPALPPINPDHHYEIVIRWSSADDTFIAEVPELPGCMADGATYEAALAAVQVVVSEWPETTRAVGRSIPATHQRRRSATALAKPRYTKLQGQYLAFIDNYTKMHRQPPAEADLQRHFRVTPPSVHQMILTLHRKGLIERTPGATRSIRVIVPASEIPALEWNSPDSAIRSR